MQYAGLRRYLAQRGLPAESIETLEPEEQGSDYGAALLRVGQQRWRVRIGRVTATKPGAFVAVWQRGADGQTRPFHDGPKLEDLLVFVNEGPHSGVFHFTAQHQVELGIVRSHAQAGKRGFRLYPPWCHELNAQAKRTQRRQAPFFTEL
ncbi:MepB family protein [Glutamicibacter sp. PS]|uniref:MepB family protein n=1 Tax=Glutamicibacter sp. PS TaxID=3075634 RepID=UPI00284A32DC|nr:MepB family protein [Glutamicibacter sp. PS]MDR4534781.1 MepB family protein [Glutamicibacter sp. PS]